MRQSFFRLLVVVIASVFIFSSCSKVPEHMNVIPSDASIVLMFNTKQLALKAQMNKFNETNVYKKIKEELNAESPELSKIFDELIKEPQNSGIKILSNVAVYLVGNPGDGNFGFVAGISDKVKFESLLNKIIKETKVEQKIETADDIAYIDMKPAILIWNKKSLLLAGSQDYKLSAQDRFNKAKEQLLLTKEKSVTSKSDFATFYKNSKDIDMWMSGENFLKMLPENNPVFSLYPNYFFKSTSHIHVEFANGEVKMNSESYMSDSLKKELTQKPLLKNFSSQESLKALPDKSVLALSFGLNMGNFYDLFLSKLPNIDQMNANLQQQNLGSIKEILESFGGDFIITINDVDSETTSQEVNMPVYNSETGEVDYKDSIITRSTPKIEGSLCMSLKTTKFLDTLFSKMPEGQLQKEGNIITLPLPFMTMYMLVNNNMIMVSTTKELLEKAQSGGQDKNLLGTETGKKITQNAYYGFIDMNIKDYPKLEKLLFEDKANNPEKTAIYNIWSIFDSAEGMADPNSFTSSATLKLTSNKENSLSLILKTVDQNIEKLAQ